ncbi:hypothetical protein SDC9_48094 [bioreactor metagenome]|uniref:Uncharacterized protein n=1 Tax=bioreactor metagenome TaxID=1076179 RepID=A0A644WHT7_9ZZZZ
MTDHIALVRHSCEGNRRIFCQLGSASDRNAACLGDQAAVFSRAEAQSVTDRLEIYLNGKIMGEAACADICGGVVFRGAPVLKDFRCVNHPFFHLIARVRDSGEADRRPLGNVVTGCKIRSFHDAAVDEGGYRSVGYSAELDIECLIGGNCQRTVLNAGDRVVVRTVVFSDAVQKDGVNTGG